MKVGMILIKGVNDEDYKKFMDNLEKEEPQVNRNDYFGGNNGY